MKRLGKQRVETLQILQALTYGTQWRNHPAVKMWRGYKLALAAYGEAICLEWISRGYKDTCLGKIREFSCGFGPLYMPPWFDSEAFHKAHRQILLAKNFDWYSRFGWAEQPATQVDGKWPYIWP